jgi:hypothetical protein
MDPMKSYRLATGLETIALDSPARDTNCKGETFCFKSLQQYWSLNSKYIRSDQVPGHQPQFDSMNTPLRDRPTCEIGQISN